MICGQWQEWKNRMKMEKMKNENEKLAKLKTRKGGLGKNEHPADWQPMKAIQAKMGQWKEFTPRWIENLKGRFRQKWGLKMKNEKNIEKHWPQMRTSNVYPALTRLATATCIHGLSEGPSSTSFIALSHGFDTSPNDGISKEVFFPCEYVAARATTCPIFQCLIRLCETSLSNCQPIMHFKHSYMHNHAFYVLIHSIILLCHTYMLHFQFQLSI